MPVVVIRFDDPMSNKTKKTKKGNAAGPWREGTPRKSGRYLVEYQHRNRKRVFVADYYKDEDGNRKWDKAGLEGIEIIRYARINSVFA